MNAIEDSGDVDLDALLEDLCLMEKDLKADVKASEDAKARSPSPSKLANKRLSSPVKVQVIGNTELSRSRYLFISNLLPPSPLDQD